MNPKYIAYSVLIAGGAAAPAAMVNGTILENSCENQLRVGCEGLPPKQMHVDQREPSQPMLGIRPVYLTTSTAPNSGTIYTVNGLRFPS